MQNSLPKNVSTYLAELVKRVTNYLEEDLVGVYLFGSASYDALEPGQSDLDVQAVVREPLSLQQKQEFISESTTKH